MGAGAVADHPDVVLANGVEHPAAHPGGLAHAVADEGHQREVGLHLHLAQLAELRQHLVAEDGLAVALAAGVIQGQGDAHLRGGDEVHRDAVPCQYAEYLGQEAVGVEHVEAVQGDQHLLAAQGHGAKQRAGLGAGADPGATGCGIPG
ncbi:hypothetical protein D3C79_583370 [compost metagenome]